MYKLLRDILVRGIIRVSNKLTQNKLWYKKVTIKVILLINKKKNFLNSMLKTNGGTPVEALGICEDLDDSTDNSSHFFCDELRYLTENHKIYLIHPHYHHSDKGCEVEMRITKNNNYISTEKFCFTHNCLCSKCGWEHGWANGIETSAPEYQNQYKRKAKSKKILYKRRFFPKTIHSFKTE